MIVDLLQRSGQVARSPGQVTDLFTVETYRSVHQMTSGISAELRSDTASGMLRALFPCGW
jgi:para-aminobenzoate synthetase/4-amino-4-deoxychorismate lyase